LPFERGCTGASAVSHGATVVPDEMQKTRIWVDNDGSRGLKRKGVFDFLAPQPRRHDPLRNCRNRIGLVGDCSIVSGERRIDFSLGLVCRQGVGLRGHGAR
jgi:hypothetical protein